VAANENEEKNQAIASAQVWTDGLQMVSMRFEDMEKSRRHRSTYQVSVAIANAGWNGQNGIRDDFLNRACASSVN